MLTGYFGTRWLDTHRNLVRCPGLHDDGRAGFIYRDNKTIGAEAMRLSN